MIRRLARKAFAAGRSSVIAFAVVLAACTTSAPGDSRAGPPTEATPQDEAVDGGTVHVAAGARPKSLLTFGTGSERARQVLEPVLLGAYVQRPDFSFAPQLLAEEAEITLEPFTVTYRIRDNARWSDGTPLTAADFIATAKRQRRERGYSLITAADEISDTEVRFTFRKPFGDFRTLFDPVLPARGFNARQWSERPRLASGPFEFDKIDGGSIVLKRNENYWGQPSHLDEVILQFPRDDLAFLLAERRVDVVEAGLDAQLAQRLRALGGVVTRAAPGPHAEVLMIDTAAGRLRDRRIREAVALSIDRVELADRLVRDVNPDVRPLQSLVSIDGELAHVPDFERYGHDPDRARSLLDDAGCPLTGGVRRCEGQPLVVSYPVAIGDVAEQIQWQLVAGDLAEVGISARAVPAPADLGFRTWSWPWADQLIRQPPCGGSRACQGRVRSLLNAALQEPDPEAAAQRRNDAGEILAQELVAVPLYQHPLLHAWRERVAGIHGNATPSGLLWNAGEWSVRR